MQTGSARLWVLPAIVLCFLPLALLLSNPPSVNIQRSTPGPSHDSVVLALTGQTMGTRYHIQIALHGKAQQALPDNLDELIATRLAYLDKGLFSTYSPDSQLSRFNALDAGKGLVVDSAILDAVDTARQVFQLSGGAFDVTIKPLVDVWGFGSTGHTENAVPDAQAIALARTKVGMSRLNVDRENMTLAKRGDVSLDLSAIAKGYAVDVVAGLLLSAGVDNYLVEIGGELASRGVKDTGEPWKVGIETPVPGEAILFQTLKTGIKALAIAASGNYRNVFHAKGQAYSHLIDPVSGAPITHDLAAVTVISESAMQADAWATALNIMGVDKGMELANQLQLAAYFIVADDAGFRSVHSDAFSPYLNQAQ